MSLKFGLYLVEQGIITCDQFCGLVKIQQETKSSLGSIAIQKNIMTIKQVATVLEQSELNPSKSFVDIAIANDFIDQADAKQLLQLEQLARPTLRKIIANVGLMTERQIEMLHKHYERVQHRIKTTQVPGVRVPNETAKPAKPKLKPVRPRQPKFQQKPVIVQQNYSNFQ